ncbi:hypothetical protein J3E72DRAFT_288514 [Bipolaris maydis]|nr:hypothetical protein J3E74DRAFT_345136 [Bipolaris maydis]KAJ6201637.1 hypothetical protein J3E72DRAFT_288514 [Bipolaris maydis]
MQVSRVILFASVILHGCRIVSPGSRLAFKSLFPMSYCSLQSLQVLLHHLRFGWDRDGKYGPKNWLYLASCTKPWSRSAKVCIHYFAPIPVTMCTSMRRNGRSPLLY